MKLLEAEPVVAPEVKPDPPEAERTCESCGTPLAPGQDWCLSCGTAAEGSLGKGPGWRAASTVIGLTVLLVLGAVVASYFAMTKDPKKAPVAAAPPAQQAQVTPPPATTTTPPATEETPSTSTGEGEGTGTLPGVEPGSSGSTDGTPLTPSTKTPKQSTTPKSPPATPVTPTPPSTTPGTGSGTTTPGTTPGTGTGTGTGTTTTPTSPSATEIQLAGDAGKLYDPYGRAKANGEPERAIDGDAATSWYVDPKIAEQIGVGYAVDLGKLQGIREIELQTPTPGFRVEIYATDETDLPPDILDTRWSHITNVSDVGAKDDGTQKIKLGAGTTKYRNLLLWFTQPPTDGARLRLTELKLLG